MKRKGLCESLSYIDYGGRLIRFEKLHQDTNTLFEQIDKRFEKKEELLRKDKVGQEAYRNPEKIRTYVNYFKCSDSLKKLGGLPF